MPGSCGVELRQSASNNNGLNLWKPAPTKCFPLQKLLWSWCLVPEPETLRQGPVPTGPGRPQAPSSLALAE